MTAESIAAVVRHLQGALDAGAAGDSADDAALVDRVRALEELKAVAAAVQARLTVAFAASREAELAAFTSVERRDRARRDIGAQIGLARRVSPRTGSRLVGLAKALTGELPHTMAALSAGRIDEYQATLITRETATLSLAHRQVVDAELAGRLGTLTARQAAAEAARIGYRLDADQAVKRTRKAESDRCVTIRKAPDTMTYVTALLPVAQGVAVYAALTQHAATAKAAGDPRSKGAVMADEFHRRLLHPAALPADTVHAADDLVDADGVEDLADGLAAVPAGVGVEIQLIMTDRALFDGDDEPAILTGYGPIPAPLARHLARGADPHTRSWVRRLYTDPHTGDLTGGDTRRRLFTHAARQFLINRDQVCRTPWCDAPIRHADHVQPHARGGPTHPDNGAGLCQACNQTKTGPGWTTTADLDGSITTTTPTGHQYRSFSPLPPWSQPWTDRPARTDHRHAVLKRLALLEPKAA